MIKKKDNKQNILLPIKNVNTAASVIKKDSLNFWYFKLITISCYTILKK
jgi:hypothetical protein